jgi:coproporphyrinogen III oxidase-like Fe-S oxidoreductase
MLFEIARDFVEKNRDFVMHHPLISYWSQLENIDEKHLDSLMKPYENNDLNLYFHVPFCVTKCSYCNFHIVIGKENKNVFSKIYLAKMKKEAKDMLSKIENYNIKTIFI